MIINLRPPSTQKQLKSFLGGVNHLTNFTTNLAILCRDLRQLIINDTKTIWTDSRQKKFEEKDHIKTKPKILPTIQDEKQESKHLRQG